MSSDNSMQCSQHGEASTTFVCQHLAANPAQRWFCDYPSDDNRWPDAWCRQCEEAFQKEGEWNERNEGLADIKLLCSHCYETGLASSVDCVEPDVVDAWDKTIVACHRESCAKQELLGKQFSLWEHKRWDYDQETGLLTFSNDGVPAVYADIEMIGSISTTSETWLWSWSNFHMLENVRTRICAVRTFGEGKGFPRLTVPKWSADEVAGWEVSAIAAHVLDAKGRVSRADGQWLLVHGIDRTQVCHVSNIGAKAKYLNSSQYALLKPKSCTGKIDLTIF